MTTNSTSSSAGPSLALPAAGAEQALTVATRLLDPHTVREAVPGLLGASLSQGLAGTALLHARLAATDPVFETAAGVHWKHAAQVSTTFAGGIGGIHSGPGALAASLIVGSPYLSDPDRHQASAARGAAWLSQRAVQLAEWQRERLAEGGTGTPWHVYDLINGLAGIGRVLLAGFVAGHTAAEPGLIAARDALTAMILTADEDRPGWWRPATQNAHAAADPHNPDGANTGLAHGIAGPIALLAACHNAGLGDDRSRDAIRNAAAWLVRWRDGDSWPPQITWDNVAHGTPTTSDRGRRDAWCYGAPGIGRALICAGQALGDHELVQAGTRAHSALATRLAAQWDTEGPTVCHGHAGVLLCAGPDHPAAVGAAHEVRSAFAAHHPFGFQHAQGSERRDQPGLLVGAAGAALALIDHGRLAAPQVPTAWNALLLLS